MAEAATSQVWRERGRTTAITAGSIVLALLAGAVLMVVSDPDVITQYAYLFTAPALPLGATWAKVSNAYGALLLGAIGSPNALAETAWQAAPLICAGLGVGLGFRAGLFNIGAQGQAIWGSIAAAYLGFTLHLPPVIHVIVAVIGGLIAGAIWGGIVGFLKARTGAHEVIVTIMLNYVALQALSWLLSTPAFLRPGRVDPIAPVIAETAAFPIDLGRRVKWPWMRLLLIALGGTVPFMSFVAEYYATKDVKHRLAAVQEGAPEVS